MRRGDVFVYLLVFLFIYRLYFCNWNYFHMADLWQIFCLRGRGVYSWCRVSLRDIYGISTHSYIFGVFVVDVVTIIGNIVIIIRDH